MNCIHRLSEIEFGSLYVYENKYEDQWDVYQYQTKTYLETFKFRTGDYLIPIGFVELGRRVDCYSVVFLTKQGLMTENIGAITKRIESGILTKQS